MGWQAHDWVATRMLGPTAVGGHAGGISSSAFMQLAAQVTPPSIACHQTSLRPRIDIASGSLPLLNSGSVSIQVCPWQPVCILVIDRLQSCMNDILRAVQSLQSSISQSCRPVMWQSRMIGSLQVQQLPPRQVVTAAAVPSTDAGAGIQQP